MSKANYKSLGNRKVLVVYDIEMNQQLAKHIMQSWGFEVDVAGNGREAVEKVVKNNYDLVLMDIQMPEMDGMEATEMIRQLKDAIKAATPIVALTANVLNGDGERYLSRGMNDYLPKPLDEAKLFQLVSKNLLNDPEPVSIIDPLKAEPAIATKKLYDLSTIYGLSGGDEAFIRQMVQFFVDTMPASMNDLENSVHQRNWDAMGKLAHKLKSTAGSMGIDSIKEDMRTVESNCKKNENLESNQQLVMKIISVINQTIIQLRRDFDL